MYWSIYLNMQPEPCNIYIPYCSCYVHFNEQKSHDIEHKFHLVAHSDENMLNFVNRIYGSLHLRAHIPHHHTASHNATFLISHIIYKASVRFFWRSTLYPLHTRQQRTRRRNFALLSHRRDCSSCNAGKSTTNAQEWCSTNSFLFVTIPVIQSLFPSKTFCQLNARFCYNSHQPEKVPPYFVHLQEKWVII